MHNRIADLNQDEKPREKLINHGAEKLTNEELLALILRSGGKELSAIDLARHLLTKYRSLRELAAASIQLLESNRYVNHAKACSILAAIELGARLYCSPEAKKQEVRTPKDVFRIVGRYTQNKNKEHLYLLSLNSRNRVISVDLITLGSNNETIVNPKDIFQKALENNAVSIILVHNHPSNDPEPSNEDILVTKRVASVGRELGILLLDHVIVTNDGFRSLKKQHLFTQNKLDLEGGETTT